MTSLRLAVVPPLLVIGLMFGAILLADTAPAQQPAVYHGNVQSHIYHRQACSYFDCKACTALSRVKTR